MDNNFIIHNINKQKLLIYYSIFVMVIKMKVKLFDEEHEKDLENAINEFLEQEIELLDIKYQVAVSVFGEDQIFCFTAMIIYN